MEAFRERFLSGSVQQQEEAFQAMQEWNRRFTESTDKNEKIILSGKLLDAMKECMDALQKKQAGRARISRKRLLAVALIAKIRYNKGADFYENEEVMP